MLFNTLPFVLLVTITFILYYLPVFRIWQLYILIVSSLAFYAWNFPALLTLLLLSIAINAGSSYFIVNNSNSVQKRKIAIFGVVVNLLLLAVFKYAGLLSLSFIGNHEITNYLLAIPLPIGISFFTFQGISLVIDTFKDNSSDSIPKGSQLKHVFNTTLYIALFPQLVAGPIVKAHDFFPQISNKFITQIPWEYVFKNVVLGYFLKMVIADNLKDFTFELSFPYFENLSSTYNLFLLFAYSIQIFADFAGYSLIAIGLSALFGYKIPQNFNFPYIAQSFSEFWQRWHISLSTFLKQYLYFPLGGNKKGRFRTYINLIIVMALGGLWHGASWSYMVWGIAHGFFLAAERFVSDKISIKLKYKTLSIFFSIIRILYVFCVVTFAWLLFKLPNFEHVIAFFKTVYNNFNMGTNELNVLYIVVYSMPVIIYHVFHILKPKVESFIYKHIIIPGVYAFLLFMIFLNSGSPQDFIYFQF